MIEISSKSNDLIKKIKSLSERKYRLAYSLYLLEGEKFVSDASDAGLVAEYIICTDDKICNSFLAKTTVWVTKELLLYLSTENSPSGIIGIYRIPTSEMKDFLDMKRILCLDRVQQPDNVGALIRSAACAGYEGIILVRGCADAYSPKAARASAGMVRKLPVIELEVSELIELKRFGFVLSGADMSGCEKISEYPEKMILVVGNEGSGIQKSIRDECSLVMRIPIANGCESLNAAVAGSILMYKSMGY